MNKDYIHNVLGTNGYFIASCGGVTVEKLKKYINEQEQPIND
jgi:putative transposase